MSDTFSKIQNGLRALKDHGIDLTVPHGVSIGDKPYPAVNKNITFDKNWNYTGHVFQIPLENRHKVQFTHSFDFEQKPYAHTYVLYPNQHGAFQMGVTRNTKFTNELHTIHKPPYDTVHESLKEYASEKSRGIYGYDYGSRGDFVPDEELQEHYRRGEAAKQARIEAHPLEKAMEYPKLPHLVHVHKAGGIDVPTEYWTYNAKTEQLFKTGQLPGYMH